MLMHSSYEAQVFDGFTHANKAARDFMSQTVEEKVTGQHFEPLTQENAEYRTIFFFNSKSGNIFSEDNLKSMMNVLNGTRDIMGEKFCYRGETGGDECHPPFTLMEVFKTHDSQKLKDLIKMKDKVPGMVQMLKLFAGQDADVDKGRGSWMQGHVLMGAPLEGYHNSSHEEKEQLNKVNERFQVKGLLGPEPKNGGWITKWDDLIEEEEKKNPDFKVYYGGKLFFPRIFGYVNIDIQYAVVSLFLVAIFMWVQIGSVFLTITG